MKFLYLWVRTGIHTKCKQCNKEMQGLVARMKQHRDLDPSQEEAALKMMKGTCLNMQDLQSEIPCLVQKQNHIVWGLYPLLLVLKSCLDSAFANEIGGYSSTDNAGKRKLGWGYTVAILDVLRPCLLPVIGRYNLNEVKSKVFLSCYRK
ncbi:hypothetical protein UY3_05706 [Chelonia mydas]|uniref:Uncharacterized protein n=1 Tax=Chelonia mydas TaxID=8469 RepID=M7BN69_CHEMY|nr:hypothetical protein UY3_05706 [Chelonia mydas]